ncbi:hypothetical protein NDU88_001171 [Pleurodeles waltl]|uniref:Uncharacterized protein n=1 Tax=Pleurodeles waltl TaxID=8319 RepID=A0AAV7LAI2_PLEWA|nr:hypothetical protein NDU88_001171 [Pleurodeles waltl]
MCCPAVRDAESRPLLRPGEASGERLRHWGRAALELRRVRRGSARIPLRGNPGRASIGKAPEKVSQEPDSVTTRYSSNPNPEFTSKVVGVTGARGAYRQGDKSSPPPQTSVNALQDLEDPPGRCRTNPETRSPNSERLDNLSYRWEYDYSHGPPVRKLKTVQRHQSANVCPGTFL